MEEVVLVCLRACMLLAWRPAPWQSDHRTFPDASSPPPDVQLLSQVSLLGPGGRNYTRDDPILLGLPAFQVELSFVGRLWFYPPSVAATELIPLMSSYTDHRVATIHIWYQNVRDCVGFGGKMIYATQRMKRLQM